MEKESRGTTDYLIEEETITLGYLTGIKTYLGERGYDASLFKLETEQKWICRTERPLDEEDIEYLLKRFPELNAFYMCEDTII